VPTNFASQVLKGVLAKVPEVDPETIDDVIIGCAYPEDVQGLNVARAICQRADIPDRVPAMTVNRFCSSGLQTIALAANAIAAGQGDIIVAGGVESMSMVRMDVVDTTALDPYLFKNKPGIYTPMGLTAELVAENFEVAREDMDKFSYNSEVKADRAQKAGEFRKEIIPIVYTDNEGHEKTFEQDELIRVSPLEVLKDLRPAFKTNDGYCTAANSSPVADGAAFVVVMSADKAKELGIKPIAKFIGYAVEGIFPAIMGMGPTVAIPKLMEYLGMTTEQFDSIELNEAFAAQAIPCIRDLNLNPEKVNPRGGAIALGHPLGATGAILTCKLLSYLEDIKGKFGMVSMCIGGGMGAAGAFEMV
jgi:acetyl-CoA acyltransferase